MLSGVKKSLVLFLINESSLKWIALTLLTLQNVTTVLLSRYVRSRSGDMFISSTAVAMSEIVKLTVCLLLIFAEEKGSLVKFFENLRSNLFVDCRDNLLIGVPGVLYAVQNNLLFLSVSNLNASVFQVSYQLKLFTTAIFFRILLHRVLTMQHWVALSVLFCGVVLAQADATWSADKPVEASTEPPNQRQQYPSFGLICIIVACLLSGFAGVFFELVLKSTQKTIVIRNIQLSVYGLLASLMSVFVQDSHLVMDRGFFHGYDSLVWAVVFVQSLGGLLVAAVVRYADNILKNFATSVAIVLTLVLSVLIFHQSVTWFLVAGNVFVIASTIFYALLPPPALKSSIITATAELEKVSE